MTHDSDYGYVQVFINFLKQIMEMIMNLFKGTPAPEEDENADLFEDEDFDEDDLYDDTYEFVCHMIGKKFDAVVKTVIADIDYDEVAVIFE